MARCLTISLILIEKVEDFSISKKHRAKKDNETKLCNMIDANVSQDRAHLYRRYRYGINTQMGTRWVPSQLTIWFCISQLNQKLFQCRGFEVINEEFLYKNSIWKQVELNERMDLLTLRLLSRVYWIIVKKQQSIFLVTQYHLLER